MLAIAIGLHSSSNMAAAARLVGGSFSLRSSGAANYLFNLAGGRRGEVTVWFADGADSVGLRALLRLTEEADDRLSGLTETD